MKKLVYKTRRNTEYKGKVVGRLGIADERRGKDKLETNFCNEGSVVKI
jgi:hypothetical protein